MFMSSTVVHVFVERVHTERLELGGAIYKELGLLVSASVFNFWSMYSFAFEL